MTGHRRAAGKRPEPRPARAAPRPPCRLLSDTSNPPAHRPPRNDSIPGEPVRLHSCGHGIVRRPPMRFLGHPCSSRHVTRLTSLFTASAATGAQITVSCPPRPHLLSRPRAAASAPAPWTGTMASPRRNASSSDALSLSPSPPPRSTSSRRIPGQSAFRLACADLLGKSLGSPPAPRGADHSAPRARGVPGGHACQKPCLFTQRSPSGQYCYSGSTHAWAPWSKRCSPLTCAALPGAQWARRRTRLC